MVQNTRVLVESKSDNVDTIIKYILAHSMVHGSNFRFTKSWKENVDNVKIAVLR